MQRSKGARHIPCFEPVPMPKCSLRGEACRWSVTRIGMIANAHRS